MYGTSATVELRHYFVFREEQGLRKSSGRARLHVISRERTADARSGVLWLVEGDGKEGVHLLHVSPPRSRGKRTVESRGLEGQN